MHITYLKLRKENGLWVFDDPDKGLSAEPFVKDTTALLDLMVQADAEGTEFPTLGFSEEPCATFTPLEFITEEEGGVIYHCERFDRAVWLCPQFWKYFAQAPETIYVRAFAFPPA
jgi:hypothetical protein